MIAESGQRSELVVHAVGPQCLVQDAGRPGWAHLGVPHSGFLDAPAARLVNRLVGNEGDAALLEVLLGGLVVAPNVAVWMAVGGAAATVRVGGRSVPDLTPVRVRAGVRVEVAIPTRGLRSYLAFAGGIGVPPVLGSRSTDMRSGIGPPPVGVGDHLPLLHPVGPPAPSDAAAATRGGPGPPVLRLHPGPRADWFAGDPLAALVRAPYVVRGESDRVGMRLDGPALRRARGGELPSEGMVLGAVQVPPDGGPVVLLADHPPTGGYPVPAVVHPDDLWLCAQLRPGETLRFTRAPPPA